MKQKPIEVGALYSVSGTGDVYIKVTITGHVDLILHVDDAVKFAGQLYQAIQKGCAEGTKKRQS